MAEETREYSVPPELAAALKKFSAPGAFLPRTGTPSSNAFGMFGNALTPYGSTGDQLQDAMIQSRILPGVGNNPFAGNNVARYNFSNFPANVGGGNWGKSAYAPGNFNPYGTSPGGGGGGGGAPPGGGAAPPGAGVMPPSNPGGVFGGGGVLPPITTPPAGWGRPTGVPGPTGGGRVGPGTTPQPIGGGGTRVPGATTVPTKMAAPRAEQVAGNPMQSGTSGSFSGPQAAWAEAQKVLQGMGPAGAEELARLSKQITPQGIFDPGTGDTSSEAMLNTFNSLGSDVEKFNYINAIDQYGLGKGGANNLGAGLQATLRNSMGKSNFDRWYNTMRDTNKGVSMEGVPAWLQAALK